MANDAAVLNGPASNNALTHSPAKLRWRRVGAGLSITALAGLTGYSKGHLSMLEKGQRGASADCLAVIADRLDCEIRELQPDEPTSRASAG